MVRGFPLSGTSPLSKAYLADICGSVFWRENTSGFNRYDASERSINRERNEKQPSNFQTSFPKLPSNFQTCTLLTEKVVFSTSEILKMADHDKSYKKLFSHPQMVEDLLRGFVNEQWVKQLDFATLEIVKDSFVSKNPNLLD